MYIINLDIISYITHLTIAHDKAAQTWMNQWTSHLTKQTQMTLVTWKYSTISTLDNQEFG